MSPITKGILKFSVGCGLLIGSYMVGRLDLDAQRMRNADLEGLVQAQARSARESLDFDEYLVHQVHDLTNTLSVDDSLISCIRARRCK